MQFKPVEGRFSYTYILYTQLMYFSASARFLNNAGAYMEIHIRLVLAQDLWSVRASIEIYVYECYKSYYTCVCVRYG